MKKTRIKKNFIYLLLYQALISLLPFITSPYISRVLGASKIGVYSYVFSVITLFLLFANLGIANYGNRLIAKNRDNKETLNKEFSSLFYLHLILSLIVLLVYIGFIFLFEKENIIIFIIQAVFMVANMLDISWLFWGEEDFKSTTIRNAIIKLITCIFIFVFVKKNNGLVTYTVIMSCGTLVSQLILWPFAFKYIKLIKVPTREVFKHFKKMLALFGAQLAVTLYSYMDKIMLGFMGAMAQLGFYENAWKLIEFPVGFITALGTVMLPKMANLIANEDKKKVEKYIFKSIRFSMLASSAIAFGMMAIAKEFSVKFWGQEFVESGYIIRIMAVCILLMSWNGVIRNQFLIPMEKDREYLRAVVLSAIVNLVMNIILIPKYGARGAAIGTVLSYLTIFFVQNYYARKHLPLKKYFINTIPYIIVGLFMYGFLMIIDSFIPLTILGLFIKIFIGAIIFIIMLLLYTFFSKDTFVIDCLHDIINLLSKRKNENKEK